VPPFHVSGMWSPFSGRGPLSCHGTWLLELLEVLAAGVTAGGALLTAAFPAVGAVPAVGALLAADSTTAGASPAV
jgi:hypothetical protein